MSPPKQVLFPFETDKFTIFDANSTSGEVEDSAAEEEEEEEAESRTSPNSSLALAIFRPNASSMSGVDS